jgi:hypothetical protein
MSNPKELQGFYRENFTLYLRASQEKSCKNSVKPINKHYGKHTYFKGIK